MTKQKNGFKKIIVAGALTGSLALGFWASKAFYTVKEVIDGDTFVTTQNQYVRFDSVYAPELDYCLGKESKDELSKLILGKKVYLKVTYIDGYKRLVASVFTINGNVGEMMLTKGMTTYQNKGNQDQSDLLKASQTAREKGIGVYSQTCTQTINPENPKCNIKGNVNRLSRLYRYAGCNAYQTTLVQLHLGDRWFCTKSQAIKAGFTKGDDCY